MNNKVRALDTRRKVAAALDTPSDISESAVREISSKLNEVLADVFALYLKTKNFHWHVSGPHFQRIIICMLDEQSEQIFAITDDIAERVRKIGGTIVALHRSAASATAVRSRTTTKARAGGGNAA